MMINVKKRKLKGMAYMLSLLLVSSLMACGPPPISPEPTPSAEPSGSPTPIESIKPTPEPSASPNQKGSGDQQPTPDDSQSGGGSSGDQQPGSGDDQKGSGDTGLTTGGGLTNPNTSGGGGTGHGGTPGGASAPIIHSLSPSQNPVSGLNFPVQLTAHVTDPDGALSDSAYSWSCDGGFGTFNQTNGSSVVWTSPATSGGPYTIRLSVNDGTNRVESTLSLSVSSGSANGNTNFNFGGGQNP